MKSRTVLFAWCLVTAGLFVFAWSGCDTASAPGGEEGDSGTPGNGDGGGGTDEDGGGGGADGAAGDTGGEEPECLEDRDCTGDGKNVCDTGSGKCVECLEDGDCAAGTCQDKVCVAQGCADSSQCEKGSKCKDGGCVPGCDSADQCPPADNAAAVKCKPDIGSDGKCVECTEKADCACAYADCDVNTWTCKATGCCADGDCTDVATPRCDLSDGNCYQCVEDGHCDANFECKNHLCQPKPTGDCTIDGCTNQNQGCDPGTKKCYTKCMYGICLQGACDTNLGLCFDCAQNTDCNGQICDTTLHECTACTDTAQCGGTLKCDASSGNCVECMQKTDCTDPARPACNSDGKCVACATDGDCTSPEKCDPVYFKCTDTTGIVPCKSCATDAECGSGKFCITNKQGNKVLEHVCAWGCGSDAECEKGFSCQDVGDPVHKVCYPGYGNIMYTATCAGSNSIGTMGCNDQTNPCTATGADPKDAECFAYQGYSICTVPCQDDLDCPGENKCRSFQALSFCSPF
ncbi:MAG: hypothetical protein HY897_25190 [Deltaproteobacteria bacterium]|nr:hypothetical protein [Deltaproteobacteria bacterium]